METILKALELESIIHPKVTNQDLSKLVYQACFGVGHMISSYEDSLKQLSNEVKTDTSCPSLQEIGNGYVRVSCSYMKQDVELFNLLFIETSKYPKDELFYEKVIKKTNLERLVDLHHSDIYRETYKPHYRVIRKEYLDYIDGFRYILDTMKMNNSCIFCIDGPCGSGKSTFSKIASSLFDLPLVSMDDYFLQPYQRTKERLSEIGGNIDYERFDEEIFKPWINKDTIYSRRYDCSSQLLLEPRKIPYSNYLLVEGSYSHHPYFKEYSTKKIFLEIDKNTQIKRLIKRSPVMIDRFKNEWIPKEDAYFNALKIKENTDFILDPFIKPLSIYDLDDVMKIWLDSNIETHDFIDEDYWISNFDAVKKAICDADVFVYKDECIKGFIGIIDHYIAGIFVDSKFRSNNIGSRLLKHCRQRYSLLSLHVYSKNINALKFYQKHGFIIKEECMDKENNEKEFYMIYKI